MGKAMGKRTERLPRQLEVREMRSRLPVSQLEAGNVEARQPAAGSGNDAGESRGTTAEANGAPRAIPPANKVSPGAVNLSRDERLNEARRPSFLPYCGACGQLFKQYATKGVIAYYKCDGCAQTVSVPRSVIPIKVYGGCRSTAASS